MQRASSPSLCTFLLSATCKAAAIHFHSPFNKFLLCLHSCDLLENSFLFSQETAPIQVEVSPGMQGETPPDAAAGQQKQKATKGTFQILLMGRGGAGRD